MIALLAPLALAGCKVFDQPRVIAPSATVVGARVTERTDDGTAFEVEVAIENPNEFGLPLDWVTYRVTVAGRAFAFSGVPDTALPPTSVQPLLLTGAVPNRGDDLRGAEYSMAGSAVYVKPGQLRRIAVESGFPEARVAFSGSGHLE